MIRRFLPTVVVTEGPSQGWGDLFDVRPLMVGPWHAPTATVLWSRISALYEGRRVVFVGRAGIVAGWQPPSMRWLQLGRANEPAEVMWLPGPVDPWRNSPENRALVDAWLADERKRADNIARAWVSIPGARARYLFTTGQFLPPIGVFPGEASTMGEIRRALTNCVAKVYRFGGGGWDDLRHSMLVRAALPTNATPVCRRKALIHDHHEMMVADLSTPLKRLIDGAWRECEQVAEAAVERLFGVEGLTDADRQAVKVADQVALRLEGRAMGADHLGDPSEVHPSPGSLQQVQEQLRAMSDDAVMAAWWDAWREDGG